MDLRKKEKRRAKDVMIQEGSTERVQAIRGRGGFVHLAHGLSSAYAPYLGAAHFDGFQLYYEA